MPRLSVVGSERKSASERVDARLAAEENRGLLRFLTCGSVDDGKSTLIGRLLYDSALVYEDQVRSAEHDLRASGRQPGRDARPCAPRRRAAGRARAEDHHRRRLSLFLHAKAEVHRRRHARPRAVHAQHGDRRVELRLRRAAGRCAERRADADPPARLHPVAARHRQSSACRQQDGPRRLRPGALRGDRRGLCQFRRSARLRARDPDPGLGAQGRQRDRPERAYALVSRPHIARASRDGG